MESIFFIDNSLDYVQILINCKICLFTYFWCLWFGFDFWSLSGVIPSVFLAKEIDCHYYLLPDAEREKLGLELTASWLLVWCLNHYPKLAFKSMIIFANLPYVNSISHFPAVLKNNSLISSVSDPSVTFSCLKKITAVLTISNYCWTCCSFYICVFLTLFLNLWIVYLQISWDANCHA